MLYIVTYYIFPVFKALIAKLYINGIIDFAICSLKPVVTKTRSVLPT